MVKLFHISLLVTIATILLSNSIVLDNAFAEELDLNLLSVFDPTLSGEVPLGVGTIFIDEIGTTYLTNHPHGGVKVYDSNGNLQLFIDANDSEITPGSGLNALTVDNDGNIYLGEAGGGRVLLFDSVGGLLDIIGPTVPGLGTLGIVDGVEIADDGTLYVSAGSDVQSFDSEFNLIAEFPNSFGVINLDNLGNVVVYNRNAETLTTFSSDGTVLDVIPISTPPGNILFTDVEIDENDNIFLMNKSSIDSCIFMFDPTGFLLQTFCEDTEDQFGFYDFNFMSEIEFGNGGHVYVLDGFEILELTFDNVWCGTLESEYDNVMIGTENDDVLKGTSGNDALIGLGGNDNLIGKSGNDCILGGDGNDVIKGSKGNDLIDAGNGDDNVRGAKGNDIIFGQGGNDVIFGDKGQDIVYGGNGNDELRGGAGNDEIFGQDGDDKLIGDKGDDVLKGNDGNDNVNGGKGNDTLFGNFGDDILNGGKNNDACEEGFGSDTLIKCETVAPLTADLLGEIFLGTAVAGYPYSFDVESENLGPDPIDNLIFSQILPNELEFNLDETIDNNDYLEYDLEFQTIPVGTTSYELKIIVTGEIIISYIAIDISADVAADAQPQTISVTSTVTTIHPNFVDPNESNNSSTEELNIIVFP